MSEASFYACALPALERAHVIPKGREGLFELTLSRNGRVLFLSERPLEELAGQRVVLALRPWPRRREGTLVQVRARSPARRPVRQSAAVVAAERPPGALAVLPLSPRAQLVLYAPSCTS